MTANPPEDQHKDNKDHYAPPEKPVRRGFEEFTSRRPSIEERVEEFTEKTREGWDRFFKFLTRLTSEREEDAKREVENRRINLVVGRPVSRVILDKKDNVILNKGDIITYAAIQKAKEAGVLDNILDSAERKS